MDMKHILEAIDKVHHHFVVTDTHIDKEKHSLLRAMKLAEEVGELNEQILGHYGYGRKEKIARYSLENLEDELADVIFSAMMVAKSLDVDIQNGLSRKMEKIHTRLGII